MSDYDVNWALLKEERNSVPAKEEKIKTFPNAERWQVSCWHNNSKTYKLTWREGVVMQTAWFDYKEHKGLWRSQENRVWEEMVYTYRNTPGITVTRQTARTDHYENLMNIKMIEVLHYGKPIESILLVDGSRIFISEAKVNKDRYTYTYK